MTFEFEDIKYISSTTTTNTTGGEFQSISWPRQTFSADQAEYRWIVVDNLSVGLRKIGQFVDASIMMPGGGKVGCFELTTEQFEKIKQEIVLFKMR